MSLKPQHEIFASAYVANGNNASAAAREAGYAAGSAHATGYRLLRRDDIQQAIEARRTAVTDSLDIQAADIVREAWSIAQDPDTPPGARVQALTLLAKRHPEFAGQQPREEHLHLHGIQETRDLLASVRKQLAPPVIEGDWSEIE